MRASCHPAKVLISFLVISCQVFQCSSNSFKIGNDSLSVLFCDNVHFLFEYHPERLALFVVASSIWGSKTDCFEVTAFLP